MRCKDINKDVFGLVPQVQTEVFTKSLKDFYYIYRIKFQKNGINVQYAVKNIFMPTMSTPTDPAFEAGETALTMVQEGILDAKINKFFDRE